MFICTIVRTRQVQFIYNLMVHYTCFLIVQVVINIMA